MILQCIDSHTDLEELVEEVEDHNSRNKHHAGDENVVGGPRHDKAKRKSTVQVP